MAWCGRTARDALEKVDKARAAMDYAAQVRRVALVPHENSQLIIERLMQGARRPVWEDFPKRLLGHVFYEIARCAARRQSVQAAREIQSFARSVCQIGPAAPRTQAVLDTAVGTDHACRSCGDGCWRRRR